MDGTLALLIPAYSLGPISARCSTPEGFPTCTGDCAREVLLKIGFFAQQKLMKGAGM